MAPRFRQIRDKVPKDVLPYGPMERKSEVPGPEIIVSGCCGILRVSQEGRCKATWKREFKIPWCEPHREAGRGGGESSFSIALICTTSGRIPASASTNQGPEQGDFT